MIETLAISRLGSRGEGLALTERGPVYIPFAAPGDRIIAEVSGDRGQIIEVLERAATRIAPFCVWFETCGGCAVQTLPAADYAAWKRGLVVEALQTAGVAATVSPLVEAHGEGRRRAVFHARYRDGAAAVGFMRARAHRIVEIDSCPLLAPAMAGALPAARLLARALAGSSKPLDILATATETGLDVDVRGAGPLDPASLRKAIEAARTCSLARLSNHGELIIEREAPRLRVGRALLRPPPGAFLQATEAGERAIAEAVRAGVGAARRVADLFSGVGTFALRLAEEAHVHAVEIDPAALAALARAAREAPDLRPATTEARDLFRRPLVGEELDPYEAVVFDPPRAGAEAQARALAQSRVRRVVGVSCAPGTFARDAAILTAGGYQLERATPIDQFRASAHVEIVAVFSRPQTKRRRGALLG